MNGPPRAGPSSVASRRAGAPAPCPTRSTSSIPSAPRAARWASSASRRPIAPRNLPAEGERAFAALIDQGALAIERALLVGEARRGEALAERERLQTTLLSSLSHDLRTPLAAILGAVTSLKDFGSRMAQADRDDLLVAIEEEASRLTRFVSNLLDMTRVGSGVLDRDAVTDVPEAVLSGRRPGPQGLPGPGHRGLDRP